ncbi:MAG: hypothetical protein FWH41_03030 [Treponema sp.]|nr:hypothetical protein [Treponema sp.]
MAIKIEEPEIDDVNLDDWHKLIDRTIDQGSGFISIGLTNIDNSNKPAIAAGSRFEVNRAFFQVGSSGEEISGGPAGTGRWYIYAEPLGAACSFKFDWVDPVWDALKGGWYRQETDNRAIATFYYSNGNYFTKIILDSYNAMNNPSIRIPEMQKGFIHLSLTNMDNSALPQIAAGSIVEVDGMMFEVASNKAINAAGAITTWMGCFIMASFNNGDLIFSFVNEYGIKWNHQRQGWYRSEYERIVAWAFCNNNANYFHGKIIIDSFSAMGKIRTDIIPTASMGNQILNPAVFTGEFVDIILAPGMYWYDLKGASSGAYSGSGSGRSAGKTISGYFAWPGGKIQYGIGQFGGNGSTQNTGGGGGNSFLGPFVAQGGKHGSYGGHPSSGIYGGYAANNTTMQNGTDGHVFLWRCW